MKIFLRWVVGFLLLTAVLFGAWRWWTSDGQWRPRTLSRQQAEITRILEGAGWVSPGLAGPKLYVVVHRSCTRCAAFRREHFPALHAAQVDTRVIVFAPRDAEGAARSTAIERSTVAELWVNRSWALAENWDIATDGDWIAEGVAPADGDVARTAVIEAGRKTVDDLAAALKANGVALDYPLLIWRNREGELRAFVGREGAKYDRVLKELGAAA